MAAAATPTRRMNSRRPMSAPTTARSMDRSTSRSSSVCCRRFLSCHPPDATALDATGVAPVEQVICRWMAVLSVQRWRGLVSSHRASRGSAICCQRGQSKVDAYWNGTSVGRPVPARDRSAQRREPCVGDAPIRNGCKRKDWAADSSAASLSGNHPGTISRESKCFQADKAWACLLPRDPHDSP